MNMGELIQMNAHMVMTDGVAIMISMGFVFVVVACIAAFINYGINKRGFIVAVCAVGIGLGVIIYGITKPKVKGIMACANGPVSLEEVAAVYDIVDIDGKMLTLREK